MHFALHVIIQTKMNLNHSDLREPCKVGMGGTDGTTVPLRYFLSRHQYRGGNDTRAIFFSIFNHIILHNYYALTKDFPKISGIETKLEARAS